jgi:phosphinothricin acetyltransferase
LKIYSYYVLNTAVSYEYDAPGLEEFRGRIENTLKKYPYLLAEHDGKIIGYAYAAPLSQRKAGSWASEASIYVDKDCRRGGVGRLLYTELEKVLKRQNVVSLNVCIAACDRENDEHLTKDSLLFHARCGYREVGRHPNCGYKFGKWYDLIWFEKFIGSHETAKEFLPFPAIAANIQF